MQNQNFEDEINLLDYWNIIWHRKVFIISLFMVSVIVTMIISLLLPKYYKSETVIMASVSDSGGLGAALSSIPLAGALAGAVGIQTPADKVMAFLKSRTISEDVINKFHLLRVFNEDEWDPSKGAWKDPDDPPLMEEAVKKLSEKVADFDANKKEGTITIDVVWKDPKLAADIANYYVTALNQFMSDKSVTMTIQIVDKAIPAEKKCKPKRVLNTAIAGFISLFAGIFIAVFQESLSKQKQLSSQSKANDKNE